MFHYLKNQEKNSIILLIFSFFKQKQYLFLEDLFLALISYFHLCVIFLKKYIKEINCGRLAMRVSQYVSMENRNGARKKITLLILNLLNYKRKKLSYNI